MTGSSTGGTRSNTPGRGEGDCVTRSIRCGQGSGARRLRPRCCGGGTSAVFAQTKALRVCTNNVTSRVKTASRINIPACLLFGLRELLFEHANLLFELRKTAYGRAEY
jgi:hypothetical protein